jgi:hypothetical protein
VLLNDDGEGGLVVRTEADDLSLTVFPGTDAEGDPIGELKRFDLTALNCGERLEPTDASIDVECAEQGVENRFRVNISVTGDESVDEVTVAYNGQERTLALDDQRRASFVVESDRLLLSLRAFAGPTASGRIIGFDVVNLRGLDCDVAPAEIPADNDDEDENGDDS